MNKLSLIDYDEIKEYCLDNIINGFSVEDIKIFATSKEYVPITFRLNICKILICCKLLNLVDLINSKQLDEYLSELKRSSPVSMFIEKRKEIYEFTLPLIKRLIEYSNNHFQPTELFLTMAGKDGFVKQEIVEVLSQVGAHSWASQIRPSECKFYVWANMSYNEFENRLPEYLKNKNWWNFTECQSPIIWEE